MVPGLDKVIIIALSQASDKQVVELLLFFSRELNNTIEEIRPLAMKLAMQEQDELAALENRAE